MSGFGLHSSLNFFELYSGSSQTEFLLEFLAIDGEFTTTDEINLEELAETSFIRYSKPGSFLHLCLPVVAKLRSRSSKLER